MAASAEDAFIAAIIAAPRDDGPRQAYADWLEERRDPRSEYLRAEWEWAKAKNGEAEARLRQIAARFDKVWVARVSRPPGGVCADHSRFRDWAPDR